jgi:hypothetical protein
MIDLTLHDEGKSLIFSIFDVKKISTYGVKKIRFEN